MLEGRGSDTLGSELPPADRCCGEAGTRDHSGRRDHDDGCASGTSRPAETSISWTARDASRDELVAGRRFEHRVEVLTDGESKAAK
jgi:hypothetical protein